MKKIHFAIASIIFLFCISFQLNSQDSRCEGLKNELETAEKKAEEFKTKKAPLSDFFNLMDDPETIDADFDKELANAEAEIKQLQGKINGGDKSPETAANMQALRDRVELMKLRVSSNYNESQFFKNPKLLKLQKAFDNMKSAELDIKTQIAALEQEMKERNCPMKAKKTKGDEITEIDLEGWAGGWKGADPSGKSTVRLVLNGTGSTTSGTLTVSAEEISLVYQVNSCKETAPNKLSCNFSTTAEDEEKYLDMKGTVVFSQAGNTIKSTWQETGSSVIRWKPNAKQRPLQPGPPRSFAINFTRE